MKVETIIPKDTTKLEARLKDILARGKAIKFTNRHNGVVKVVTEWNIDKDGDLLAETSTGTTKYVCPYSPQYEITEISI